MSEWRCLICGDLEPETVTPSEWAAHMDRDQQVIANWRPTGFLNPPPNPTPLDQSLNTEEPPA